MSTPMHIPLPENNEGVEKNIESSIKAKTAEQARMLYFIACKRFLDVNNWGKISGKLSATFQLTDAKGKLIMGEPKKGDHFKIYIPGLGSSSGKGYEWAEVEKVIKQYNEEEDAEYILMRVRPADNPATADKNVAHFLSNAATSSFVVMRKKNVVTAAVYGRNETPNIETRNIIDKLRNAIIGMGAITGFSNAQWQNLVNGILQKKNTFRISVPSWLLAFISAIIAVFVFFKIKRKGF